MTNPVILFAMIAPPIIGALVGAWLGIFIDKTYFKNSFNYFRFSAMYFGLVFLGTFIGAEIVYIIWGKNV